jgi:hypothetical protein
VSQHLLHHLDVGTGGDGQTGGRVPELVEVESGHTDGRGCPGEGRPLHGLGTKHRPAWPGEDQDFGIETCHMLAELVAEEAGNGHFPALVTLGGAPGQVAVDEGHRLGDQGSVTGQVQP